MQNSRFKAILLGTRSPQGFALRDDDNRGDGFAHFDSSLFRLSSRLTTQCERIMRNGKEGLKESDGPGFVCLIIVTI